MPVQVCIQCGALIPPRNYLPFQKHNIITLLPFGTTQPCLFALLKNVSRTHSFERQSFKATKICRQCLAKTKSKTDLRLVHEHSPWYYCSYWLRISQVYCIFQARTNWFIETCGVGTSILAVFSPTWHLGVRSMFMKELLTLSVTKKLSRHMTVRWGACRFGRTVNGAKCWREPKSHIKALLVGLDWINVRLVHKIGLTRGFIVIKRRSASNCFEQEISAETVIPTPSRGRFSHQGGSWSWLFR